MKINEVVTNPKEAFKSGLRFRRTSWTDKTVVYGIEEFYSGMFCFAIFVEGKLQSTIGPFLLRDEDASADDWEEVK